MEWGELKDLEHQQRLENLVHQLHFNDLYFHFQNWFKTSDHDLLEGVYLIARYRFPELEKQSIVAVIEKLRLDVWLEMNYELSPYEKVRMINYVLYEVNGFKGNVDNYHDPSNSFINQVLESRRGNPILMAVVYILIAQKLNIPIYGINLPQHFVLAYTEEIGRSNVGMRFNDIEELLRSEKGKVLFYINAFNGGAIFTKGNLQQFLTQIKIESRPDFLVPCSNLDIIKRVLRNLASAYEKQNKQQRQQDILSLLYLLGEPPLKDFKAS
jgi:regulator of sirC expression with transglutaminase-like and TPR domain